MADLVKNNRIDGIAVDRVESVTIEHALDDRRDKLTTSSRFDARNVLVVLERARKKDG